MVPPVHTNSGLPTGSSIGLQTCALHRWVGNMAAIKNTTLVEFVRSDKGMALCKHTVGVKHKSKLDDKKTLFIF